MFVAGLLGDGADEFGSTVSSAGVVDAAGAGVVGLGLEDERFFARGGGTNAADTADEQIMSDSKHNGAEQRPGRTCEKTNAKRIIIG